jgi:hypothetical protein
MANLLGTTTIGGHQAIHVGNISSYSGITQAAADGRYLLLSGGTLSGNLVFPNDSAVGVRNADGSAGFRPDDQYGNIYTWNSSGGYYVDANSYYLRNTAGSVNWLSITGSGTVQANADFRAPIFYDSADTGYYVDPNSTSNIVTLYASTLYGSDVYTNGGWFRNHSNNNGIYWSGTSWHLMPENSADFRIHSGNSSEAALRIETNGTTRGYVYANSSNEIGFLNNGRSWRLRVYSGGAVESYGDFRAPIFYDSADTNYYVDPNSNSRLVNLGLGGVTPDVRLSVAGDGHLSGYLYLGGSAGSASSWGTRTVGTSGAWITNASTVRFDNVGHGNNWSFNINSAGAITINRHIDANTVWGLASVNTIFVGWYGGKIILGNSNDGAHDYANSAPGNSIISTNKHYFGKGAAMQNNVQGAEVLSVDGVNGRLFTVTDDLSDSLFSVNTIAGLPVIEAFADNTVVIGKYGNATTFNNDGTVTFQNEGIKIPYYNGGTMWFRTNTHWDSVSGIDVIGGSGEFRISSNTGAISLRVDGDLMASGDVYLGTRGVNLSSWLNQSVLTSAGPTFANVYSSGWFRTYDANGLYNETHANHWYATSNATWNAAGNSSSYIEIAMRTGGHQGTIRGYVYADNSNNIGFLNNGGSWAVRVSSARNVEIFGSDLTLGALGSNSTNIIMGDNDEGSRTIHCNSNRIGFLTQAGSWGSWSEDNGAWSSVSSMYSPIYYDYNDSNYYLDPNSSSRIRNLYVGDSGSDWSDPGGWGTQFHVSNGPHAIIRVYARDESIETVLFSHNGGQSKVGSGTNHDFAVVRNFVDRMTFYSGYTYSAGYFEAADSLRAPIFYDSNDTNYYLDPSSTGTSFRGRGEILLGPNTSGQYTRLGGNGGAIDHATISASNGNLHIDCKDSFGLYLNYYSRDTIYFGRSGEITSDGAYYNGTAAAANSVAWTNVSSRPTALSQFTNDLGNYGGFLTSLPSHNHDDRYYTESEIDSQISNRLYQARVNGFDVNAFNATGLYRGSTSGWSNRPTITHNGGALLTIDTHPSDYHSQLFFDTGGDRLYFRNANAGSWGSWLTMLHSGNYTSYSPSLTGGGASGTWSINVTGTAARATRANGNFYIDDNYGVGVVGLYDAARYQGVFAMGDSYKLPANGTSTGSLYGLAWSHPNAGGVAGNLNTHGLLVMENGTFLAAISGSIRSRDDMRAPIFYDQNDTNYYLDPNGTSNLLQLTTSTRARWNMPRWWTDRSSITSDQNYWTGSNGWGVGQGTWANAWKGGFSGWDIWGTDTEHPQGSGYIHAQGIVSGQHLATSDGSSGYGWMMVGAADAVANRYWLRGKWSSTTSEWVEMITTGNIGSQSVNYATSAGFITWTNVGSRPTALSQFTNDLGNYGGWQSASTAITTSNIGSQSVNYATSAGAVAASGITGQTGMWTSTARPGAYRLYRNDDNSAYNVQTTWGADVSGFWSLRGYLNDSYHAGCYVARAGHSDSATYSTNSGNADTIDGRGFRNTGSNDATNADNIESNGITYYSAGVSNFSGNATDGALYSQAYSSSWQHQIAGDYRSGQIALRGKNDGSWREWRTVLDSQNYATWAIARDGDTVSGSIYFLSNRGATLGATNTPSLQAYATGGNAAFMSFHRSGNYAVNMGLDSDNVFRIGGWSASANRLQMDMSGNLTMAGDVIAFSDARVKTNVQTIEGALEKTLKLRGVTYNRIDSDDTATKLGVIAQEVLEIIPEVVTLDNNGTYGVSYGNIVGLLIEAIKEQQAQIDDLKKQLNK